MDSKKTVTAIRTHLKEYCINYNLKSLVLGLSGGIDSALCAALAQPVCKEIGIPLIGRSITIETNKPEEIKRAESIGVCFCDDFKEKNLTTLYRTIRNEIEEGEIPENPETNVRLRFGNIKARIRMIYLYNLAQKFKGLVLSTDNYTEYLLGFWTLHGDVGDLGMIQMYWKTEVYELSAHLVQNELSGEKAKALQECIDAVPTDGLGITNSDLDQLEAKSYLEVDNLLKAFLESGEMTDHPVLKRHKASEFKRNNPYNFKKFE